MQLAADEISIRVDGALVHLRPTLRAALRLERRHGGFERLVRAVADGNLSVIADVIKEASSGNYSTLPDIIEQIGHKSFRTGIETLSAPILDFVFALAGVAPDASGGEGEPTPAPSRLSFAEHHARLYRIATGWLGWPPETAWNATAAEIIEAQKGRVELLRAIFGGSEEPDEAKPSGPVTHSADEIATGLTKLKMLAARGGNRAR